MEVEACAMENSVMDRGLKMREPDGG